MKNLIEFLVLMASVSGFAQDVAVCEKELLAIVNRRNEIVWDESAEYDQSDSLGIYNGKLEKRLLECTKAKESLLKPFESLLEGGIGVTSSPDKLFHIYSWDDQTGGTMRFAENIFQFGDSKNAYSQTPLWDVNLEDDYKDPGYFYSILDEVVSDNKKYYVVKCISIGSSAASLHKIKIFSIDGGKLNDKAVLIKTKTGIRNELGYEIDLSSSVNRGPDVEREWTIIQYDAKSKTIAIPLIREDGKVTTKKIRYRFNGQYFVKI